MVKLTLYDKIFVIVIVVFSLGLLFSNLRLSAGTGRQYVTVHADNRFVKEISLTETTDESLSFAFGPAREHRAVLEISGGRVRMLPLGEDLCPRGICSHTGWISREYQSIVCVPNRIVVKISGARDENVDGVTF